MIKKKDRIRFVKHVESILLYEGAIRSKEEDKVYILSNNNGHRIRVSLYPEQNHKSCHSVFCRFTDNIPPGVNNQYSGKHNFHYGETDPAIKAVCIYFKQLMNF